MTISPNELKHLANLAYLNLEPDTIHPLTSDINAIIQFMDQLNVIDTSSTEPLTHPVASSQRLRDDIALSHPMVEALERIAPQFTDHLYWVPKVISSAR